MTTGDAQRKTVLVVEDDLDISGLIASTLESEGYLVETASNGQDALASVAQNVPDAMLIDIMLPRVDGRQLIRACKAQPATSRIPIIVMSAGYDAMHDAELASLVFMTKPFDIEMLLMLVDDAVSSGDPPAGAP